MIATVIRNRSYDDILRLLDDPWIELAEIRLDLCTLSDEQIEDIFSNTDTPLIATCRSGELPEKECERRLSLAISSGARYADLEINVSEAFSKRFRKLCRECGSEIIRSYHNFECTPPLEELQGIVKQCFKYGADIAKVVTFAHSAKDCATVEALYCAGDAVGEAHAGGASNQGDFGCSEAADRRLIAFAMGEQGRSTRLSCLKFGAPFSYASLSDPALNNAGAATNERSQAADATDTSYQAEAATNESAKNEVGVRRKEESGDPAALGQYNFEEMHELVYGKFKGFWRVGDLQMPASKSFAQRAIIAAALAQGQSHLHKYTPCGDSESAIRVAEALGASVHLNGTTLTIDGTGAKPTSLSELNCGESGLLTRICIPLLSKINTLPLVISGEKTLTERPLKGVQDIMASFGVAIRQEKIPFTVTPPIIPGNAEISGRDGSQLISGLLMTLPLCDKNSKLYISEPKSIPYMFITQDLLRSFGVRIKSEMEGDEKLIEEQDWSACSQISFTIKGGQQYVAADFDIEGDWSAAANFLVAGAIFGKAEVKGLNTQSLQADITIADILVNAGAVVSELEGSVCVSKAPLEAFEADLSNAPDLFPICSVLAAFCDGITTLQGIGRLHAKESDRAAAIMEMLSGFGVEANIEDDVLFIKGETLTKRLINGNLLKGGEYKNRHDHRMAMALKIASMGAESPISQDFPECVEKSFPGFFEMFDY